MDEIARLRERLQQAQQCMESVQIHQGNIMGAYAQKFQSLYFQCMEYGTEYRVYHYAEYLRLLVLLHFESIFDGGGSAEGLYLGCKHKAWLAGLILNPITGEESPYK